MLDDSPKHTKEVADLIKEIIGECDGYKYIFDHKYEALKGDNITFYYRCSQSQILENKTRKGKEKQRDKVSIERFSCNGLLRIIISNHQIADINLVHKILHIRPNRFEMDSSTKEFIQQNINQTPQNIYSQIEQTCPNITQKQ
ncbi:13832_t:CDS:2, partial [Racocetra fulgida]